MADMTALLPLAGYDCESTGTDVERDRIVSAALIRRDQDGTTTRTWLIDPGVDIPAAAVAIHGITTAMARADGVAAADGLDSIAQALADALLAGLPLVIYNASYDIRILEAELVRHGLPTLEERLGAAVRPVIDPLVIDRTVDRYCKGKRTLPDLTRVYGLPSASHQHDATDDVVNTIALLDALLARHPELPTDLGKLHDFQVAGHAEWANHFNEWLTSQGRTPTASLVWP